MKRPTKLNGWLGLALLGSLSFAACEPGRGEVRPWKAEDHERPSEAQRPAQKKPTKAEDRVERTWMGLCSTCHGPLGRGDGPQGERVRAPDLTRDEWLESVTDEQIAAVILHGNGEMPGNPNMKDDMLQQLVARIRRKGR